MEKGRDEPSHWHFMRTGRVVVDYHIWRKGYCLVSFQSFTLRYFVIAVIRNTIQTTLQLYSTPSPRLHPLWQIPWIVIILLSTGKTRKMAIGVSVGVVMLIALVTSIVCFVRRRKARALSNQLTTPLTRANAGDTGHVTAMETRNNSRDTSLAATRAITTASYGTQTSPLSPQATGQHSVNLSPSMNSVSLQTIPSGPPPAYPGSPDSPPPYPGIVEVPQYPPPGQSYPWEQRPQPSAPPPRPWSSIGTSLCTDPPPSRLSQSPNDHNELANSWEYINRKDPSHSEKFIDEHS